MNDKEYLTDVVIRDLSDEDKFRLENNYLDYYRLKSEGYKIVLANNDYVLVSKYDYDKYGEERLKRVVFTEEHGELIGNFLSIDFEALENSHLFNNPKTIDVEFVTNKSGTYESVFTGGGRYYIRQDSPNEKVAQWFSAFKKNGEYHDNAPIRTNISFRMGDNIEKVTFTNWNGEGVYKNNYNEAFSYNTLKKDVRVNDFIKVAKEYGFKARRTDYGAVLKAQNTDGKWVNWVIYDKVNELISIVGNTDVLNIWLSDTRKDLTPQKLEWFIVDLNYALEQYDDNELLLKDIIDPEDWQAIANIPDASQDIRYNPDADNNKEIEPDICDD